MQPKIKPSVPGHHLTLQEVVKDLVADGRLAKEAAEQFLIPARSSKLDIHPLVVRGILY